MPPCTFYISHLRLNLIIWCKSSTFERLCFTVHVVSSLHITYNVNWCIEHLPWIVCHLSMILWIQLEGLKVCPSVRCVVRNRKIGDYQANLPTPRTHQGYWRSGIYIFVAAVFQKQRAVSIHIPASWLLCSTCWTFQSSLATACKGEKVCFLAICTHQPFDGHLGTPHHAITHFYNLSIPVVYTGSSSV